MFLIIDSKPPVLNGYELDNTLLDSPPPTSQYFSSKENNVTYNIGLRRYIMWVVVHPTIHMVHPIIVGVWVNLVF